MSIVERCHEPLWRAYQVIQKEAIQMGSENAIQAAVKTVDSSVGPNRFVSTLLIYGAFAQVRLPMKTSAAKVIDRVRTVPKATKLLSCYYSKRQV